MAVENINQKKVENISLKIAKKIYKELFSLWWHKEVSTFTTSQPSAGEMDSEERLKAFFYMPGKRKEGSDAFSYTTTHSFIP